MHKNKSYWCCLSVMLVMLLVVGCSAVKPSGIVEAASLNPSPIPMPTPLITPSPIPTPTPTPVPQTAKFTVVGDIMLHQWQMDFAYDKGTKTYDFYKSFDAIDKYLKDADYTIGNLETVFAGNERGFSDFPMFNALDEFGKGIKDAGFDFLTTANNHSNDKGTKGILRTIEVLDELGIDHVGTYKSAEERDKVFIKEINGMKFAFLSFTYGTNGLPLEKGKPYLANIMSESLIQSDIARAKLENPDFIVVMPHMGNEYELYPKQVFKNWIQLMCDAGADIVLASHPHVLQPIETMTASDGRECFVIYSLGNFISSQRTTPRDAGVILELNFEKKYSEKAVLKEFDVIPTWVKFKNKSGAYDIRVLPVVETLEQIENGENDLRPNDVKRLKNVLGEAKKIYPSEIKGEGTN